MIRPESGNITIICALRLRERWRCKIKVKKQKIIVIVGPTASGKSELAVKLAKKFNGEIISADSRQIYRGLDIGTGKVQGKWKRTTPSEAKPWRKKGLASDGPERQLFFYRDIPHYCLDFVPPRQIFTVAEYKKCAEAAIKDISSRGKIPILVGGTGFWIDAAVYDLQLPEVPPDRKLRRKLEKKSSQELLKILKGLDAERAKTIEQKNPRRLIRAIEVARVLGKVPQLKQKNLYQTLWIGLNPQDLKQRIKRRVQDMIRHGLVPETKKLLKLRVGRERIKELGFEYREVLLFIEKGTTKQELKERIVKYSRAYAQRQMTWFKKNKKIHWINALPLHPS